MTVPNAARRPRPPQHGNPGDVAGMIAAEIVRPRGLSSLRHT